MSIKGMNIDGWKVVQMRNDIKYIKNYIKGSNVAIWAMVIDISLAFLIFALNHIFNTTGAILKIIWVIVACVSLVIPLALLIFQCVRVKRMEKISLHVSTAKELVKMFDDEICYAIMSAESFNNNLNEIKQVNSRKEALLTEFYFIETCYYLNKTVDLILRMDNNFKSVIAQDNYYNNSRIAKERIINVISLTAAMYEDVFDFSKNQSDVLKQYSVCLKTEREKEKYDSLKEFTIDKEKLLETDAKIIFK